MNTETGRVYRTEAEIAAATLRGEKLVQVDKNLIPYFNGEGAPIARRDRRRWAKLLKKGKV